MSSSTCAACPGFVEFVERGETVGDEVTVLAERLLAPIRDAGVDTLLLGCTHYPFLARTISDVMGRDVVLVSSADETAFEVRGASRRRSDCGATAPAPGVHRFLVEGDIDMVPPISAAGCSAPSSTTPNAVPSRPTMPTESRP